MDGTAKEGLICQSACWEEARCPFREGHWNLSHSGAADSLPKHTHKLTRMHNQTRLFCLVLFCLLIWPSSHSVTALCCTLLAVWTCSAHVPVKPFWNWACNRASGLSTSVTLFSFAKWLNGGQPVEVRQYRRWIRWIGFYFIYVFTLFSPQFGRLPIPKH